MNKDSWEVKKLGDIATYINGYSFKPSDWEDDGLPIIRIQNLNSSEAPYNYTTKRIDKKYVVNFGEILISWSASLGVYEWKGTSALLNQHIFKVQFDKIEINKFFFKYQVDRQIEEMLQHIHGATMKHITKKNFDNIRFLVPPPPIQEQIVKELDALSDIITKKKEQFAELDKLAQATFYDMFGDPVENEKEWNNKLWSEVLTIYNGKNQKKVENKNGEYPICGSGGIMGYADAYICPENTVIIGRKGNINKPIFMRKKFWNVDTAFGLVANYNELNPNFLFYFCLNYNFEKHNKAVTIPSLTKTDLLKIAMPCPPLSLQNQFAEKIETIDQKKALINQSLTDAQLLFDYTMDKYFN